MEGLYFPYSENKGADQLRGYREADLRLCFRICKKPVFSRRGSIQVVAIKVLTYIFVIKIFVRAVKHSKERGWARLSRFEY